MVSSGPASLTKIGFRRDVRLFLALLIGFFVALILVLVALVKRSVDETGQAIHRQRQTIVRVAAADFSKAYPPNGGGVDDTLLLLRSRYFIPVIKFTSGSTSVVSGPEGPGLTYEEAATPQYRLRFGFDATAESDLRFRFIVTSILCCGGAAAGFLLLLLYLPRITRPIEDLLDQARELGERGHDQDEPQFLIDSFRRSITTLRAQETELKRLHDAEKRRADELEVVTETLTRSLNSGFLAVNRIGTIVSINGAGQEILGHAAEIGGHPIDDLEPREFGDFLRAAFESRSPRNRAEITIHSGEVTRVVGLSTVPLSTGGGEFLGMLVLFADLTDLRGMEQRLRSLQTLAELGEMSAAIAHEFRNSLSTILGYLRLARRASPDPDIDRRLKAAEDESTSLSRAIDGLLSFARPVKLDRTAVNMRAVTETVLEKLAVTLDGIDVQMNGANEVWINGDGALLGRALENVIRNAGEAMQSAEVRRITISVNQEPEAIITIDDTGEGIAAGEAEKLFLPFYSRKAGGLGMGLAIARKVVLLHGGSIALTRRPEGGTRVQMTFPPSGAAGLHYSG